jgi:uncharacterized membrane protein
MFHRFLIWRLFDGHFLLGLACLLFVAAIVILIVTLTNRKYKSPRVEQSGAAAHSGKVNASQDRLLAILNEQKAAGAMGEAEYEERRLILEGGRGDNHANEGLVTLKERYARGELTTGAYIKAKNKLFESN